MQNLFAVSPYIVCAYVRGPKIGDAGTPPLGMRHVSAIEIRQFPTCLTMTSLVVLDGTVHEGRMRSKPTRGSRRIQMLLDLANGYIALKLGACSWEQRRMETQKGCQNVLYSRMMITMMI